MLPEADVRAEYARSASPDEINSLIYDADERILLAALDNPKLQEKHAEALVRRADVSPAVLAGVAEAAKGKWMSSESIRLALAQHPHTPKRIAMAAIRQLFLFDLVRLSVLPSVPPDIRRFAEDVILRRVPHLPIGEKLTLARRGPARVAAAILAEGHPQAIKLALGNAFFTEAQVLKTLAKDGLSDRVIIAIAKHPKWSCRSTVRLMLTRNAATPLACVQGFINDLTQLDLSELSNSSETPASVRKLITAEIDRRKSGWQDSSGTNAPRPR
jgi:hypothetical protein